MSEQDAQVKKMVARIRGETTAEEQMEAYAHIATKYDSLYYSHSVAHEVCVDRLLQRLPASAGSSLRVLDAGCGTGLGATYAREQRDGLWLAGVDYSKDMLGVADGKGVFDMTKLLDMSKPFELPGYLFDGVLISAVLVENHLGPEILPNVMPHLRVGRFAVCSVRSESLKKRRAEYERLVQEAGCEIVAEEVGGYSRGTETATYLELKKVQ